MYFLCSFVSLMFVHAKQLAALHRIAAMLVDARSELETIKLNTPGADELHAEISRAQGLCWRIINDELEMQANSPDRRRRAARVGIYNG